MHKSFFGGPGGPGHPGSTTAAFVLVVLTVGAVTRIFGLDAGLISLVLAIVALAVGPYVYGGLERSTSLSEADDDPESAEDSAPRGSRSEPGDGDEPDPGDTGPP